MNRYLNKLIMYHEIHRLSREGHSVNYICDYLALNWRTVKKYLSMDESQYEAFITNQNNRKRELAPYLHFVKLKLEQYPNTSSSQMHDWLKEHYDDFPSVHSKTVYNFVMWVRQKYNIAKISNDRDYFVVEELPFGKQAQVDFGEYNIRTSQGNRKKVYFFAMVLSRSRQKYVYFTDTPFTTSLAIAAHEKAFEYFKGIPQEVVYDQDKVFMVDENKGDLILTGDFQAYIRQRGLNTYFCRKSDPESKGKIENVVRYVKQNFLYNRPYYDLDTLNDEAIGWLNRTANHMPHARTKLPPVEQWHIEQQYLKPYTAFVTAMDNDKYYTVRKDNTISYKSNLYTLPEGTYSNQCKKVLVNQQDNLLIITHADGSPLCKHMISYKKGQTITNTDHKRDKTGQITSLIKQESKNFEKPQKALKYFESLRKEKPRYIRDQILLIRKMFTLYDANAINKALEYCIQNNVYSAVDFDAVAKKIHQELNQQQQDPEIKLNPMPSCDQAIHHMQPNISEILDYETIMPN